jgi:hypothetical protein
MVTRHVMPRRNLRRRVASVWIAMLKKPVLLPFAWLNACAALLVAHPAAAELPVLPRGEAIAAYSIGFGAGLVSLRDGAQNRIEAGSGPALRFTAGMAFWHEIPINLNLGQVFLKDRQAFTEFVVTCTQYGNTDLGCSNPSSQESTIQAFYGSVDTGYQHRFQFSSSVALVPGALIGYQWSGALKRGVQCDGCKSLPVDGASLAGAFVTPTLKFVFTNAQFLALTARSEWFLSGDVKQMTTFGLDVFAP